MTVNRNYMIQFPIGTKQKLLLKKKDNYKFFLLRSSECGTSVSSIPRRTSIRSLNNTEKYSGIKCALPSFTTTLPNTLKGLEKHYTPIKNETIE